MTPPTGAKRSRFTGAWILQDRPNLSSGLACFVVILCGIICNDQHQSIEPNDHSPSRSVLLLLTLSSSSITLLFIYGLFPRGFISSLIASAYASLHVLLTLYWIDTGDHLRCAFIANFSSLLQKRESLHVFRTFHIASLALPPILFAVLMWLHGIGYNKSSTAHRLRRWTYTGFASIAISLAVALNMPSSDSVLLLAQSAIVYKRLHSGAVLNYSTAVPVPAGYRSQPISISRTAHPPSVLLIIVESLSSFWLNRIENGESVTPFLNRLSTENGNVGRFYANATYTINGQASILCSLPPPLQGSIAQHYPLKTLVGLPQILHNNGFTCTFLSASEDLDFANTRDFMGRVGFNHIQSLITESEAKRKPASSQEIWGWGLADEELYKRTVAVLADQSTNSRPSFITVATVVNHYPFDELPPKHRHIYRDPSTTYQRYANSMRYTDLSLAHLIDDLRERDLLESTILLITGDHAIKVVPDHNSMINDSSDEAFSVPLICALPKRLRSQVRFSNIGSQMDIAPTILDLLGITTPSEFLGVSLVSMEIPRPICVQQSGEGFVSVVSNGQKYIYNVTTGKESIVSCGPLTEPESPITSSKSELISFQQIASLVFTQQRALATQSAMAHHEK